MLFQKQEDFIRPERKEKTYSSKRLLLFCADVYIRHHIPATRDGLLDRPAS
jgi:hypothetical protein